MFLTPEQIAQQPEIVESTEKATLRLVAHAIFLYREVAKEIFFRETDLPSDIAEDITREAVDTLGMSRIGVRLFGKTDYKRARYHFNSDYAVQQALFIDSKAEDYSARNTITIQLSQTSMTVKQYRRKQAVEEQGELPVFVDTEVGMLLTTTIFVKYNYKEREKGYELLSINVVALPNKLLQIRYNPSPDDSIWLAGRNAPQRGEKFRVRISLPRLKDKARWRVQEIRVEDSVFTWEQ
jgi:hypothetical protein